MGDVSKMVFLKVTHIENYLRLIIWCTLLAISRRVPQNSFKESAHEVSDMSGTSSKSLATPLTYKLHYIVLIVNTHCVGGFCVRLETLHSEALILNFVYFICT